MCYRIFIVVQHGNDFGKRGGATRIYQLFKKPFYIILNYNDRIFLISNNKKQKITDDK